MGQITQAFVIHDGCTGFYSAVIALGDFKKRMACFNLDLKNHSLLEEDKDSSREHSNRMWSQGMLVVFDPNNLKNGAAKN